VPNKSRYGGSAVPKSDLVVILEHRDLISSDEKLMGAKIEDFNATSHYRRYGSRRLLRFLCFRIGFVKRFNSDVGDIYPRGYKYTKDTLQGIKDRYKALIDSGFYY
jgi:hypothetical protein